MAGPRTRVGEQRRAAWAQGRPAAILHALVFTGLLFLVLLLAAGAAASSSAGACSWQDLTPTGFLGNTYLYDVAVVSPADAWAVGDEQQALILHWDGKTWRRALKAREIRLTALTVGSPADVWAVGQTSDFSRTVTMHWNGSRWLLLRSPSSSQGNNFLEDVVALARKAVWTVGHVYDSTRPAPQDAPLAEYWNGRDWRFVRSTSDGSLSAVDGNSQQDVWAVGVQGLHPQGLALHWNGRRWTPARLPPARYPDSYLRDVAVVSPTLAWAIGSTNTRSDHPDQDPSYKWAGYTLVWNGTRWTADAGATRFLGPKRTFAQIVAAPGGTVWAVVSDDSLARWDGRAWKRGPGVPYARKTDFEISDLEPISDRPLWLSGTYWNSQRHVTQPLITKVVCH
jgi:hypothetical protein